MGDTGSLGIGTGIATLALLENVDLLLFLVGGLYVLETLSVIIQVGSFRLFRRRVFRMAPIHHHFELVGLARDDGDHPLLDPGRGVHGPVPGSLLRRLSVQGWDRVTGRRVIVVGFGLTGRAVAAELVGGRRRGDGAG